MPIELTPKKAAQLEKVEELARSLDVEILAHFYQRAEVKKAASFVGGSSEVVEKAVASRAAAVMMCGASFMADEARRRGVKQLLIPRDDISCPLAEAVSLAEVKALKTIYPEAVIVADMKARPEIRALADMDISPLNAEKKSVALASKEVIALPGAHLADWAGFGSLLVARWPGATCQVHELAALEDLNKAMAKHPRAKVAANLLCRPEIKAKADFVGDSAAIKIFCLASFADNFIIISEAGLAETLSEVMPEKNFYETEAEIFCPNMKLTTLKSMISRLENFAGNRGTA